MPEIIMPRLSDSMQEGTILRWLKANGDEVARDQELVEIETDKATMTYEAEAAGILAIIVGEGETVPVGTVIARIGDGSQSPDAAAVADAAGPAMVTSASTADTGGGNGRAHDESVSGLPNSLGASPSAGGSAMIKASPVARRTAQRLSVDLAGVAGSGPGGRILKADVVAAGASVAESAPAAAPQIAVGAVPGAAPVASSTDPGPPDESTGQELSRNQLLIARRMTESRTTVPDFALQVDVDMQAALDLRQRLKQLVDPPPSVNDIIVKATAVALRRHPAANGSYRDDRFERHEHVNVGVAVATADALVVPTVRDADIKSLGTIAAETRRLIERVQDRTIAPSELDAGTFTVSNLGMYGIDSFEGIINPPQAAILCVGSIRERPVAIDRHVEVRSIMTLTLACDHRILYGASAAEFLADVRQFLEEPTALTL